MKAEELLISEFVGVLIYRSAETFLKSIFLTICYRVLILALLETHV